MCAAVRKKALPGLYLYRQLQGVKPITLHTHKDNGCLASQIGTAMPDQWPQALVTTPELAKITKFSPRTISGWIATKKVPFIKIGSSIRFRVADVMAALEKFTVKEVR